MDALGGSLSNFGLIGTVGIYADKLGRQEAGLTAQSTSGLISSGVTGLGAATSQVLDLQPQITQLSALTANASLAAVRLQTAQTALTSISSLAQSFATSLTQLSTENGSSLTTGIAALAGTAESDLGALAGMLNTKAGDVYVFAGSDGTDAPIPDPGTITNGPLSSSVALAVSGLGMNSATTTLSSIIAAVSGNPVFSPSLNTAPTAASVDVGPGESATVSLPATSTAGMGPASATSTGSGVNDLIAVLSAVSNLASGDGSNTQFGGFLSGLKTTLNGALGGLDAMTSTLAVSQQQVAAATSTNAAMSAALTTQMNGLTSVDLPTVATRLTATQNQLMASYEIINDLKSLSLASYL